MSRRQVLKQMDLEVLRGIDVEALRLRVEMKRSRDKNDQGKSLRDNECVNFYLEIKATPIFLRGLCPILGSRT
jgi:hypothetical protein